MYIFTHYFITTRVFKTAINAILLHERIILPITTSETVMTSLGAQFTLILEICILLSEEGLNFNIDS